MAELHTASSALVVLLGWDSSREIFVDELIQSGLGVRVIVVDPRIRTMPDGPNTPLQLQPDAILQGQVTTI
jgi:hypothetical protein